jgi:hypothetical protein
MKWRDINHTHHGLNVIVREPKAVNMHNVFDKRTIEVGVISCEGGAAILKFKDGHAFATFPGWYEVEILE